MMIMSMMMMIMKMVADGQLGELYNDIYIYGESHCRLNLNNNLTNTNK